MVNDDLTVVSTQVCMTPLNCMNHFKVFFFLYSRSIKLLRRAEPQVYTHRCSHIDYTEYRYITNYDYRIYWRTDSYYYILLGHSGSSKLSLNSVLGINSCTVIIFAMNCYHTIIVRTILTFFWNISDKTN